MHHAVLVSASDWQDKEKNLGCSVLSLFCVWALSVFGAYVFLSAFHYELILVLEATLEGLQFSNMMGNWGTLL
jgi:hypothetical protein